MNSELDIKDIEKLRQYYFNILARKDYSQKELRQKGLQKSFTPAQVEKVLNELLERNFLNDTRLAENIWEFYNQSKGRLWIQQKMQARGIEREIVNEILNDKQQIPSQALKETLTRKYSIENWSNLDNQIKQKVIGYLSRKGFTNSWEILKDWQEKT